VVVRNETKTTARSAVLAGGLGLTACAGGLSTSQPAHVPEKGHSQIEAGVDVSFSTRGIRKVVDASRSLEQAAQGRPLTDAEKRSILIGASELAINPPALIPHVGFAVSPFERWELGLRIATSGWRFGVRRQLLVQEEHRFDLSVGLGAGLALFTPPVDDVFESVAIRDFVRWNIDAPISFGQHGSWYRWWAGPRIFYSNVSQTMTLTLAPPNEDSISGDIAAHALYLGGFGGAAFGYRSVFIGPELVVVGLVGNARMDVLGTRTHAAIYGLLVYPAFALMGEF
jgi:hypothetical protein